MSQLAAIVQAHGLLVSYQKTGQESALRAAGWEPNFASLVSEYPRQMPTEIHYAMASVGAWIAGAVNIQYLSYYATIRQITHKSLNSKYGQRMGYSSSEADSLHDGGLAFIPLSLYGDIALAQGDGLVFGSIPIDEINLANVPSEAVVREMPISDPITKFPGIILDKYYRAPFWARKPAKHALLGSQDVLRDHYTEFYSSLQIKSLVRCKHYCAPVVRISSFDELRTLISNIPIRSKDGLFFRGQGKLHLLNRSIEARQMLFGDSCSTEPSLVTSASRDANYSYDNLHFALRAFLEQKISLQDQILDEHRLEEWQQIIRSPSCHLDRAIMALAQHYGLPTHGLDITRDPGIAAWFATNRFLKSDGFARYESLTPEMWSGSDDEWPVVIACQAVTQSIQGSLHECAELDQFGISAMRPSAQSALFFQGGHSDHANRLAETVVCVFQLAPAVYDTGHTFDKLFPSHDVDPAYKVMLEFASSRQFGPLWGHFVNRFHTS